MGTRIKIKQANDRITLILDGECKGKTGLITNGYAGHDTFSFRFLVIPTLTDKYMTRRSDEECEVLSFEEAQDVLPKDKSKLFEMIPLTGCTLGSDPEIFVVNRFGRIIPAFTFLPSKKEGNPYWDGFQAEFTTDITRSVNPRCLSYVVDDVRRGLSNVLRSAREKNPGAELTWDSVIEIPRSVMRTAKPEHVDLGCAPSLNAYTDDEQLNVGDPSALPIRFAGCHIHLGTDAGRNVKVSKELVKSMDRIFGIASIPLFHGMEDSRRRMFYGRAGEFRLPEWGIEYRVPSSAALAHPVLFHITMDLVRAAMYVGLSGLGSVFDSSDDEIRKVINLYDLAGAKEILRRNKSIFMGIFNKRYRDGEPAWELINSGALEYLSGLGDMERSWRLRAADSWAGHSESINCSVDKMRRKGGRTKCSDSY